MNDRIRRLYEMFVRVLNFMTANSTDFTATPFIASTITELKAETDKLAALAPEKVTATAAAKDSMTFKGDARDDLRDALEDISETWQTMPEAAAEANKFRLPIGNSDQNLIAVAKSFAADAAQYKTQFTSVGMPTSFITDLQTKIDTFEEAIANENAARGGRVGTNAAFNEPARKGKLLVERLKPAVKRHYRNNPKKMAEWLVASYLERPPKSPGDGEKKTKEEIK